MLNPGFEHPLIPMDHLIVAVCLVNDMTKTAGGGHVGLPWAALRLRRSLPGSQYQIVRHPVWWELLHRNWLRPATTAPGLGCAKTPTCCGAVEWRSQASNVLSFPREARLLPPTDAQAQKSRKLRSSYTSVARLTSCLFYYYVSSRV